MQDILDKIERHITINDINYNDTIINNGDSITVVISNITIDDIELNKIYTFVVSKNYVGDSELQKKFSVKWNNGNILNDNFICGKLIACRNNMIKVDSDVFTGWIPKMYIEKVY